MCMFSSPLGHTDTTLALLPVNRMKVQSPLAARTLFQQEQRTDSHYLLSFKGGDKPHSRQ